MRRLGLRELVDRLEALPPFRIDVPTVATLLADGAIDDAELRPYVGVRVDKYARRLVHRGARFDVMVLTWAPGQATPIHNHAGNCGWVRLCRGRIVEDAFRLAPSCATGLEVAAVPPTGAGRVELIADGRAEVATIGAVATVDRQRAIHRLSNPQEHARDEVAVTLHVYSLPHDTCLVFDAAARTCGRRDLSFDPPPSA